jgi:hypothetical protein
MLHNNLQSLSFIPVHMLLSQDRDTIFLLDVT